MVRADKLAIVTLAHAPTAKYIAAELVPYFRMLKENVLVNNPGDVIIFHMGEYDNVTFVEALQPFNLTHKFVKLDTGFLAPPAGLARGDYTEIGARFPLGYKLMCRFYAHGVFRYLSEQRYDWAIRFDTHSVIHDRLEYSMVELMKEHNYVYGTRFCAGDDFEVSFALPEATHFWLTFDKVTPTFLSEQFTGGVVSTQAWARALFNTNFWLVRVDWWMQLPVQRFLSFIDATGGYFKYRWGDHIVHTMALSLFANKSQIHEFDFKYSHRGEVMQNGQRTCTKLIN